jgi:hypothetical protein
MQCQAVAIAGAHRQVASIRRLKAAGRFGIAVTITKIRRNPGLPLPSSSTSPYLSGTAN